ncbi:hypothetical protein P154DRAFT_162492 [Amniculicola lignicola CBS 123094]|uniref:Ankyrin n=1 Tax=Amniculicola lignicola CBS 123094 TaxID=1392246 RepID=A0A6A5WIW8_9PLEO|nr:hypothetical protein P154DRAFT_162492 [Amniculicola lignicola CBS 123094]
MQGYKLAIELGRAELLDSLLSHEIVNADAIVPGPSSAHPFEYPALRWAAKQGERGISVASVLLEHGAKATIPRCPLSAVSDAELRRHEDCYEFDRGHREYEVDWDDEPGSNDHRTRQMLLTSYYVYHEVKRIDPKMRTRQYISKYHKQEQFVRRIQAHRGFKALSDDL